MDKNSPIGFFDSGLGGISVLREAKRLLPEENFIYFGDSANAPYGTRTAEQIIALSDSVMQRLISLGCKAVVVACNTATGEAVDVLRERYPGIIIVGVEPAVKPAVRMFPGGRILVLATPQCLKSRRVTELVAKYGGEAELVPVPCPGLMEFVERGELSGGRIRDHLSGLLSEHLADPVDAAVLGCTHYPFVKGAISEFTGTACLIDGNLGIAAQLKRRLEEKDLLRGGGLLGKTVILNSSPDPKYIERSELLLNIKL